MVGTHWLCVTRYRSMSRSACSASNRSIATTVAPVRWQDMLQASGAA